MTRCAKAEVSLLAIICAEKFILRNVARVALLSRIPSESEYWVKRCVLEELNVEGRCALHNRKCASDFILSLNLGSIWPLAWLAPIPVLWLVFGETRGPIAFAATWAAYALGCCNILPAYMGTLPVFVLAMALTASAFGFAGSALCARYVARHGFASRRRVRFSPRFGRLGTMRRRSAVKRDGSVACLQPDCCALPDPGRFRFWTSGSSHFCSASFRPVLRWASAKEITNARDCCDHVLRVERRLRHFSDSYGDETRPVRVGLAADDALGAASFQANAQSCP